MDDEDFYFPPTSFVLKGDEETARAHIPLARKLASMLHRRAEALELDHLHWHAEDGDGNHYECYKRLDNYRVVIEAPVNGPPPSRPPRPVLPPVVMAEPPEAVPPEVLRVAVPPYRPPPPEEPELVPPPEIPEITAVLPEFEDEPPPRRPWEPEPVRPEEPSRLPEEPAEFGNPRRLYVGARLLLDDTPDESWPAESHTFGESSYRAEKKCLNMQLTMPGFLRWKPFIWTDSESSSESQETHQVYRRPVPNIIILEPQWDRDATGAKVVQSNGRGNWLARGYDPGVEHVFLVTDPAPMLGLKDKPSYPMPGWYVYDIWKKYCADQPWWYYRLCTNPADFDPLVADQGTYLNDINEYIPGMWEEWRSMVEIPNITKPYEKIVTSIFLESDKLIDSSCASFHTETTPMSLGALECDMRIEANGGFTSQGWTWSPNTRWRPEAYFCIDERRQTLRFGDLRYPSLAYREGYRVVLDSQSDRLTGVRCVGAAGHIAMGKTYDPIYGEPDPGDFFGYSRWKNHWKEGTAIFPVYTYITRWHTEAQIALYWPKWATFTQEQKYQYKVRFGDFPNKVPGGGVTRWNPGWDDYWGWSPEPESYTSTHSESWELREVGMSDLEVQTRTYSTKGTLIDGWYEVYVTACFPNTLLTEEQRAAWESRSVKCEVYFDLRGGPRIPEVGAAPLQRQRVFSVEMAGVSDTGYWFNASAWINDATPNPRPSCWWRGCFRVNVEEGLIVMESRARRAYLED